MASTTTTPAKPAEGPTGNKTDESRKASGFAPRFLVIGRLHRDLQVVSEETDQARSLAVAEQSVREARYDETFVLPILAAFSASGFAWSIGQRDALPADVAPALNPGAGNQPVDPRTAKVSDTVEIIDPHTERQGSTAALGDDPEHEIKPAPRINSGATVQSQADINAGNRPGDTSAKAQPTGSPEDSDKFKD